MSGNMPRLCIVGIVSAMVGVAVCLAVGRAGPEPGAGPKEAGRIDLYGDPLPPGALVRLGCMRFRHPGWRKEVAFAPDGKTLVSVTQSGDSMRFWEPSTGKLLGEIETEDAIFASFTFAPDGKTIASAGNLKEGDNFPNRPALCFWDTATRKRLRTIKLADRTSVGRLFFMPDGKTLLGNSDAGMCVWDAATGAELLRYKLPSRGNVTPSPDGQWVAAGGDDGFLYLWEWQTAKEPRKIKATSRRFLALTFSLDGQTLAGSFDDANATVHLWDVASGKVLRRLPGDESTRYAQGLAFSPDGKLLATTDYGNRREQHWSGGILLWDTATGKLVRELPTRGESANAVVFSKDSRWLAAGTESGLHVWDMRSGAEVTADDAGHRGYLSGIAVATNSLIATASDDHTARLWDPATGKLRRTIRHGHWVRAVALSPDGAKVATSSLDDTVTLWDAASGRVIYKLAGHGAMGGKRAVSFTADGKFIVSWGDDYYLRKWDVSTAKAVLEHPLRPTGIKVPDEDTEPKQRMEFLHMGEAALSPGGNIFVLSTGLNFHVFDVSTGKELRLIPNEGSHVVSATISPDGKYLLASAWGKQVQTKLPDGRTQFSSVKDQPICLWELSTGKLLKKVILPEGGAGPVAFSTDGKLFAAATDRPDRRIRLWDVATGKEIGGIEGFRGAVRSLAFLPDGKRLISGMEDSSALVWDLTRER